jgi:hypothetical protein
MALGSHVPEWTALAQSLNHLTERACADNAIVVDAWGHLWCRARPFSEAEPRWVLDLAKRITAAAEPPLPRGGRVDTHEPSGRVRWYARSFAGVYVVVLLYGQPFDPSHARIRVHEALPELEALTIALPPPDGPDATSGVGRQRTS